MPSQDQILDALRAVIDPELRDNIVELDMVRSIDVGDDGAVAVDGLADHAGLPDPQPLRDRRPRRRRRASTASPRVDVSFDVLNEQQKGALQRKLGRTGGLPEGALAAGARTSSASARARAASASRR